MLGLTNVVRTNVLTKYKDPFAVSRHELLIIGPCSFDV